MTQIVVAELDLSLGVVLPDRLKCYSVVCVDAKAVFLILDIAWHVVPQRIAFRVGQP